MRNTVVGGVKDAARPKVLQSRKAISLSALPFTPTAPPTTAAAASRLLLSRLSKSPALARAINSSANIGPEGQPGPVTGQRRGGGGLATGYATLEAGGCSAPPAHRCLSETLLASWGREWATLACAL